MTVVLPPHTGGTPYRVAVVCLGNICRSPMAAVVLADRFASAGLQDQVEVVSAGTGGWHVGDPMDPRAAALLGRHGYDGSRHRAQQLEAAWLEDCDLLLAMDGDNQREIEKTGPAPRLRMFREFDPAAHADLDVPDPYYGGDDGFERVLAMIERTSDELAVAVARSLRAGRRDEGAGG